jgi:hypothetical protein
MEDETTTATSEGEEETTTAAGQGNPPEPGIDALDLAGRYGSAPDREAFWIDLSADEQNALKGIGVPGPISVDEEGFQPVPSDHPNYSGAVQVAEARMRAGLADIRRGALDLTAETRGRIEGLASLAEGLRDNGEVVQRAVFLIEQARAATFEALPFGPVVATRTFTAPDGSVRAEETDGLGRVREVASWTREEVEEARTETQTGPAWDDPAKVSLEDFAELSPTERIAFVKANPDDVARLKGLAEEEAANL